MNYKNIIKGFDIVSASDVFNDLVKYSKQGALRGKYLGFANLHEYYTMSLPGVTDWTGFPGSGKTQILMEILLNTSEYYGWKHLVYFPDVGDEKEIIADLIHKRTGKTFDKRYKNHIEEFEIAKELTWIEEHFKILTKRDLKAKLTPYQFWDLAVKLKNEGNSDLHTASIDSWKDMKHNVSEFGRDDKYLEDVLSYRNSISEKYKLHLHTIIHPIKTDKDPKGDRKPPSPYDLKGGTEWYNNGRNMVTVHRPVGEEEKVGEENKVDIYFNKIKPRSIGEVGMCSMYFDVHKFRYYWADINEKIYAIKDFKKHKKRQVLEIDDYDNDKLPF